jgi:phosphoribosylanthranilate isomerase
VAVDVKICGLTRAVDAELADAAGAAYLGVIFAGGPRNRTPEEAREVLLARRARKVGVFGAQSVEEVARIAAHVGLDVIQLHGLHGLDGDAQADVVRGVRAATGLEVWAVIRTADGLLTDGDEAVADAADALVVDALAPGVLGGSGVRVPWLELGESLDAMQSGHRVVLAGGLMPENVREAIDYVSPHVVDVSSGVESAPGVKDHQRVRAFIAAVRASTESEG